MISRNRKSVTLAGVGIAVLSLELAGLYAAAPRAWELVQDVRGGALTNAGRRVAVQATTALVTGLTRASAAVLVRTVKGTSAFYAMMLSVTPPASAETGCANKSCPVSTARREAHRARSAVGYSNFSATDFAWRKSIK